jgi:hypothetical protein
MTEAQGLVVVLVALLELWFYDSKRYAVPGSAEVDMEGE